MAILCDGLTTCVFIRLYVTLICEMRRNYFRLKCRYAGDRLARNLRIGILRSGRHRVLGWTVINGGALIVEHWGAVVPKTDDSAPLRPWLRKDWEIDLAPKPTHGGGSSFLIEIGGGI